MVQGRLLPDRGVRRRCLRVAVAAAAAACLLAPMLCAAESTYGTGTATSQLRLTVVVPPVFRVLQVTPTRDGYDYRVWTNMRTVVIDGREHRFDKIGETTLSLRSPPDSLWVVLGL
jgi:hypothetical protein